MPTTPRFSAILGAFAAIMLAASPAIADQGKPDKRMQREDGQDRRESHRGDQDFAFRAMRAGQIMPLSEIEARVIPRIRGARYIGSTFDRDSAVYTLKFMREASVIWVEVDGRSGRIIGQ